MNNYPSQRDQRRNNRNTRYQNQPQHSQRPSQHSQRRTNRYQNQPQTIRPTHRNSPPSSVNPPKQGQMDSASVHSNPSSHPPSEHQNTPSVATPAAPQQDIRNIPSNKVQSSNTCHQCGETGHFSRDCQLNAQKECYTCNGFGHYARDCPLKQKQDQYMDNNANYNSNVQCYNCGEYGHYSRECRVRQDNYVKERRGNSYRSTTRSVRNDYSMDKEFNAIFKSDNENCDIKIGKIGWIHDELVLIKHIHRFNGKCNALTVRKLGKNSDYDKIEDIDDFSLSSPHKIDKISVLKSLWIECNNKKKDTELMDGSVVKIKGKGFGRVNKKKVDGTYIVSVIGGDLIEAEKKDIVLSSVWEQRLNEVQNVYSVRNDGEMDVYDFLEEVADKYMWRFIENGVTSLKYLLRLSLDDLKQIGMALGHRKYFAQKIKEFDQGKWNIEKKEKKEERERLEKERMIELERERMDKMKRKTNKILEEEVDDLADDADDEDDKEDNECDGLKRIKVPGTPQSPSSADVETGYEDDIETGYEEEDPNNETQIKDTRDVD